jgi:hypothetical protein
MQVLSSFFLYVRAWEPRSHERPPHHANRSNFPPLSGTRVDILAAL